MAGYPCCCNAAQPTCLCGPDYLAVTIPTALWWWDLHPGGTLDLLTIPAATYICGPKTVGPTGYTGHYWRSPEIDLHTCNDLPYYLFVVCGAKPLEATAIDISIAPNAALTSFGFFYQRLEFPAAPCTALPETYATAGTDFTIDYTGGTPGYLEDEPCGDSNYDVRKVRRTWGAGNIVVAEYTPP